MNRVENRYEVRRGDPITMGGLKDELGNPVGYSEAKHSGTLVFIGPARPKTRVITVDPEKVDPDTPGLRPDRKTVKAEFYTQDYQIVREDEIKLGDKIISRNGLKGVISMIVDDLGKDEKGRPYEAVVNYGEVWRDSKSKVGTPEYELEEETFIKQGKRKAGTVVERRDGDGKVYFFLIDKMAQDQLGSGLRMSTTMLSGMWEWFLQDVMKDGKGYTQTELNDKLTEFVERYFGEKGTFVPTLKALHYKAVKRGDSVRIEINDRDHDPSKPLKDDEGEWVYLPHTFAGRNYEYAYIPNYISRVYFDGRTVREYYQIDPDNKNPSASNWYWTFIVKQLKNMMYMFPKNESAVNLVATPYARKGEESNYMPVKMDVMDVLNAGGNPYDPNVSITLRKEPVTDRFSIQTHPVDVDWSGDYNGIIGIHPEIALKATIDYDGDQVVAWTPIIDQAVIKLNKEDEDKLKESLKKKNYETRFEDNFLC